MSERNFLELARLQWEKRHFICVGLDSDTTNLKFPKLVGTSRMKIVDFNKAIVQATVDVVWGYKPQIAFYERLGPDGLLALRDTVGSINAFAPELPVILDAKRGDIESTNAGYIEMAFNYLGVDAITISPYLGMVAVQPFLDQKDKGIIVLCRTSNKDAGEFQDLMVIPRPEEQRNWDLPSSLPLYKYVAYHVSREWNKLGNCGLVTGATYPKEIEEVRKIVGDDLFLLLPGVGAQGGDLEAAVKAGRDSKKQGIIVNVSRSAIFASSGPDFSQACRKEVMRLNEIVWKLD